MIARFRLNRTVDGYPPGTLFFRETELPINYKGSCTVFCEMTGARLDVARSRLTFIGYRKEFAAGATYSEASVTKLKPIPIVSISPSALSPALIRRMIHDARKEFADEGWGYDDDIAVDTFINILKRHIP